MQQRDNTTVTTKIKKPNATENILLIQQQNKPTSTDIAGTLTTTTSFRSRPRGGGGGDIRSRGER
jgi:hypothetical protein